uniref:ATP-dependent helicase C-terminal domain-containing protein n=1 Tax=Romanomermis culicivorax TaxID=13658 RepID=A0A915JJ41_ROMCU
MHKSKLSRKLSGYARTLCINKETKQTTKTLIVRASDEEVSKNFCSATQIETFINAVKNARNDSRILMEIPSSEQNASVLSLKFLNLDPSANVKELFLEPRSIILAGGTMQPTSDLTDQLFTPLEIDENKIKLFSFDHVIPSANVLPIALSCGPSNRRLEFTFETRRNPQIIDDLSRLIINLCNIVPGGIVCFFPSYDYERLIFEQLKTSGLLSKIETKKNFFREPKESSQLASLLEDYSRCIKLTTNRGFTLNKANSVTGAVLFAVVGGKLSEGINFSDDLGRCVVMVGMPYAFKDNPELLERMKFMDNAHTKNNNSVPPVVNNNSISQNYYDNLCWKSINQTIGRSIRHAKDYAAILLVDSRYAKKLNSTRKFLPNWIEKHLKTTPLKTIAGRRISQRWMYDDGCRLLNGRCCRQRNNGQMLFGRQNGRNGYAGRRQLRQV